MNTVYDITIEGLADETYYLGSTYNKTKAEETVSILNFLATNGKDIVINNHLTGDTIKSVMKSKRIDSINDGFFEHHVKHFDKEGIKLKFGICEDEDSEIPYKYILICDNEENHNIAFIINRFPDFDSAQEMAAELSKIKGNEAYEEMKSLLADFGVEESDYLLQNLHWSSELENQSTMRFRIMTDVYDTIGENNYHHKTVQLVYTNASGDLRLLATSDKYSHITAENMKRLAVELNNKFEEMLNDKSFSFDQTWITNLEKFKTYLASKLAIYKIPTGIATNVELMGANTRFYSYEIVS